MYFSQNRLSVAGDPAAAAMPLLQLTSPMMTHTCCGALHTNNRPIVAK